ncbi:uncharacterized protein ARMOST_21616 [Armillaria ostoyae]|uniref:Uncharacterized protein n=1 Tax=Armillaria ostoyae TaxID=47428 RepID=A0A284SAP8_ARMOS|nr:uncharacterized protein ARMOST_21616 [Armillaria ostoyae]
MTVNSLDLGAVYVLRLLAIPPLSQESLRRGRRKLDDLNITKQLLCYRQTEAWQVIERRTPDCTLAVLYCGSNSNKNAIAKAGVTGSWE